MDQNVKEGATVGHQIAEAEPEHLNTAKLTYHMMSTLASTPEPIIGKRQMQSESYHKKCE